MTLPKDYFDELYVRNPDPWAISGGWYEQRKRAMVMAALPRTRFRRVFEPGCANGELTVLLARRADEVVAWDAADQAVRACRAAVAKGSERSEGSERAERSDGRAGTAAVTVEAASIPGRWPLGGFDLMVLSELGYYLAPADLASVLDSAADSLAGGGVLVAVHWRHEAAGYPATGDEVHAAIAEHPAFVPIASYLDEDFALDVLVATDGTPDSVARATGVLA